ncbi:hypothetical protein DM02DRAFT_656361 [Periconia macrospinosa]|uniref:Uncharacterized protein n=1 Tax=Periconia macrospinosa TaxID=97972 RepID=A0A2V1DNU2_9PLEO|nr:hypothetical protein DM02DRAFT_656361 [Periconia macrospinosa]
MAAPTSHSGTTVPRDEIVPIKGIIPGVVPRGLLPSLPTKGLLPGLPVRKTRREYRVARDDGSERNKAVRQLPGLSGLVPGGGTSTEDKTPEDETAEDETTEGGETPEGGETAEIEDEDDFAR